MKDFLFKISEKNGITTFEMNKPNASVNVFSTSAARQIDEYFENLDVKKTKAIVFKSTKPFSFLNGAELIMTKAIKSFDDIQSFTEITRRAYERVAHSPVPTIAAISGNCFGCGMEFVLGCDYRFASNSFDTQFYLTELIDYYLLPLFGSTFRLEPLVGLTEAVDLLVFGKKIHSEEGLRIGLIDKVLDHHQFDKNLDDVIELLKKDEFPKKNQNKRYGPDRRDINRNHQGHKKVNIQKYKKEIYSRIESLPPMRQDLYKACFEEILRYSKLEDKESVTEGGDHTVSNTFKTLSTEASRCATTFFFRKEMAKIVEAGSNPRDFFRSNGLAISLKEKKGFVGDLLSNIYLDKLDLHFDKKQEEDIVIRLKNKENISLQILSEENEEVSCNSFIHFPFAEQIKYVEFFCKQKDVFLIRHVLSFFNLIDWHTVLVVLEDVKKSTKEIVVEKSPSYRLLSEAKVFLHTDPNRTLRLQQTLWFMGFEMPVHGLFQDLGMIGRNMKAPNGLELEQAYKFMMIINKTFADLLSEGTLKHRAVADVLAHLIFGFPTGLGSFLEFVKEEERRLCA